MNIQKVQTGSDDRAGGATQRAAAKMLGVNEVTVARDLGKDRGATNVAKQETEDQQKQDVVDTDSTNVADQPSAEKQPPRLFLCRAGVTNWLLFTIIRGGAMKTRIYERIIVSIMFICGAVSLFFLARIFAMNF